MVQDRRTFIKKSALAIGGLSTAISCSSAKSYSRIIGANDTVNVGIVGVRSRGAALMSTVVNLNNTKVTALCDVDSDVLADKSASLKEMTGESPKIYADYRKMLENKDIDAIVIASADHTHAPFAIYALQAGKHVYCEKPCSYNPDEGFQLVKAQKAYGKLVQVGSQQRSAPTSQEAIQDIRDGFIGDVYDAQAWYTNNRGTIGNGKTVAAPKNLNWDLWQGPAPRVPYRDNIVHYNWHWFKHWGTGEINNNGMHEMDICRWALDVHLPNKVMSQGGRFHFTDDDWEFFDTQTARFEFEGGKSLTWVGRSCNGRAPWDLGRGAMIYGTKGSMLIDRNVYIAYDRDSKEIKRVNEKKQSGTTDLVGLGGLTDYHMANFFEAIRTSVKLNAPVSVSNTSNHLCHVGNMAQFAGITLETDPQTGKILNHDESMKHWSRDYEPGWELNVR